MPLIVSEETVMLLNVHRCVLFSALYGQDQWLSSAASETPSLTFSSPKQQALYIWQHSCVRIRGNAAVWLHTHTHHTLTHTHSHTTTHTHTYTHTHTHLHTHTHTHTHTHSHTQHNTHSHTLTHTHSHTHTHTPLHTYTHTRTLTHNTHTLTHTHSHTQHTHTPNTHTPHARTHTHTLTHMPTHTPLTRAHTHTHRTLKSLSWSVLLISPQQQEVMRAASGVSSQQLTDRLGSWWLPALWESKSISGNTKWIPVAHDDIVRSEPHLQHYNLWSRASGIWSGRMHDTGFCRYPIFLNSFWLIANTDIYLLLRIYQYVCSLGTEPMTFCAANTMLYHWATGTHTFPFVWKQHQVSPVQRLLQIIFNIG